MNEKRGVGRPKGGTKAGGRTKGTPNQKTLDFAAKLVKADFDPVIALAKIGKKAMRNGDDEMAHKCASTMLPYLYPRRKSLDLSSSEQPPVSFKITLSKSLQTIQDAADEAAIEAMPDASLVGH